MLFSNKNKEKHSEQQRKNIIYEEYTKIIRKMVMEEIKTPGTHNTTFKVDRIGEGYFLSGSKNTYEAAKFLNTIVFHRSQIISISAKGDDSLLKDYIVTYWTIDDVDNEIYNKVISTIDN